MIVRKTSVFPASRKEVFAKLQQLKTLQYIAWPYASFQPIGQVADTWAVGQTSSYRFRLFGCIPYGTHTIHIIRWLIIPSSPSSHRRPQSLLFHMPAGPIGRF